MEHFTRGTGSNRNVFTGKVDGDIVNLEVVGTYGAMEKPLPICRIHNGKHENKALVINWYNGTIIKEIIYKE